MDKAQQDLMQAARKQLRGARYTVAQREQILRTLDLLLTVARAEEKTEENARSASQILANVTRHHNLLAIIQQQADELDALKRISVNLTSSLVLQAVLERVVTEAMHLVQDAREAHIFLFQEGALRFGASLDSEGNRNILSAPPRANGLTYTVARNKKTIIIDDLRGNPLFDGSHAELYGSILGIPLMMDDVVIGVMNMLRWSVGGFTPPEMRLLELLADHASIAIINARLHQQVANQALRDSLTTLPNRRALDTRLEAEVQQSARTGLPFSLLMMDLDGFKAINDTYGHPVGDTLLAQFAQHLNQFKRSADFLARYGGDEMTMLLPETDPAGARQVTERLKAHMQTFVFRLPDGKDPRLGLSGGVATYPFDSLTASGILRAADEALYHAKKHARGGFTEASALPLPHAP